MFEILLNIMCLGSSAYFFGFAFFQLIGYQNNRYRVSKRGQAIEADLAVVMGICILTVYAQIFSLFYQVGTIAFCIVVLIDIFIIIFYREKLINSYKGCFSKKFILFGIVLIFVGFIVISLANQPPGHYDTDLYHAQSIHWIEEFGIVPGLGNLHNRLAYNSSFFPYKRYLVGNSYLDVLYMQLMHSYIYFIFIML